MAFAYSSSLQNRIALAVWGVPYASISTVDRMRLDNSWSSGTLSGGVAYDAQNEVAQLAQYFEQASSSPDTSFPQPEWDRLFVAKSAMVLAKTVRPDRFEQFVKDHETALDESIDTFTRDLVSSTSLAGQGVNLSGIRAFTIDHCVKRADVSTGLRRRLFPSIAQIDGHTQWTLNFLWNHKHWHFRKRQVLMRIYSIDVSGATWTESTKTLTDTGAFTNTRIAAGARFLATGGTSVLQNEYTVSSRTSDDAIVLETSLSDTAGNLTAGDIAGVLQAVVLEGLNTGETFDAVVSRKFFYDGNYAGRELNWTDPTGMAKGKAGDGTTSGIPVAFRWEKYGSAIVWHLSPFPSENMTLRGAVTVSGPGTLSTSASLDTAIAKFPSEFGTVIRDMVLARTLLSHRASDGDDMMRRAMEQCESLLPTYADQGHPTRQQVAEDVYNDMEALRTWR